MPVESSTQPSRTTAARRESTEAPQQPPRKLQSGSSGDDVKQLQQNLKDAGFDPGDADGKFGPKTERAVRDFQRNNGLDVDGVAGRQTQPALAAAAAASAAARATTAPATPPARTPASPDAQQGARTRAGAADQAAAARLTPGAQREGSPPGVDVGAMTPQELADMKRSSDPRVRDMAKTAERAKTSYADLIKDGGKVTVSSSAGNGGKPVVTLVPPGFDPSRPADVHTHYHGWNATAADGHGHSSGTYDRIRDIQKDNPQAVFVLPECNNAQAGAYHADWSNVKSQAQTTRDALSDAGVDDVGKKIVSAHSAGGFALQRAMNAKRDGSGIDADRLDLQDCLYGPEGDIARWGSTPAAQNTSVRYFHGTNNAGRDRDIARAFAGRYEKIEVRAGNGHNAHDRTVADYMES